LSQTVRKKEHSGSDFAERFGLLENGDVDASLPQRASGGDPPDSAAHHGGAEAPSPPKFVFHVKIYRGFELKRKTRKALLALCRFRTAAIPLSRQQRKDAIES
jgi:hypothetical protein